MRVVLVHGMGRTPLSMLLLAARLKLAGLQPKLFGYCAAIESFSGCSARLEKFITDKVGKNDYFVAGHSLGSVLLRSVCATLDNKPKAYFLIAPPTVACKIAVKCSHFWWYRLLTGEMGQLLSSQYFMASVPVPDVPVKIYAGVGGPTGRRSPFGLQRNDGVLFLNETLLPDADVVEVDAFHTFIMNKKYIADDIMVTAKMLKNG